MTPAPRQRSAARRPSFTLVELLVVISIIGILLSITSYAVFRTVKTRKMKLTQTSLSKLYAQIQRQMKAVIDDARTEPIPQSVQNLAGGNMERARIIWIKLRLKQQFPISYAEAINPAPGYLSPEPAYGKILNGKSAANNPASESAACLLMALTARSRRGASQDADFLSVLEKADTDGDGVPEIIDAYGNPVYFYRWPMPPSADNNFTMMNTWDKQYGSETFHDPQDPTGTLQAPGWGSSATYAGLCHPVASPYPTLYLIPVIVSAGPDGKLGLNLPTAASSLGVSSAADSADNIYSDPTQSNQ